MSLVSWDPNNVGAAATMRPYPMNSDKIAHATAELQKSTIDLDLRY